MTTGTVIVRPFIRRSPCLPSTYFSSSAMLLQCKLLITGLPAAAAALLATGSASTRRLGLGCRIADNNQEIPVRLICIRATKAAV